jgi:hypothetical protein
MAKENAGWAIGDDVVGLAPAQSSSLAISS